VHPSRIKISGLKASGSAKVKFEIAGNVEDGHAGEDREAAGSAKVKFEIAGNGEDGHAGEDRTAGDLAAALKAQVADRSSAIYQGAVTASAKKESLELWCEELPIPTETEEDMIAAEQKKRDTIKEHFLSIAKVVARTESRRQGGEKGVSGGLMGLFGF